MCYATVKITILSQFQFCKLFCIQKVELAHFSLSSFHLIFQITYCTSLRLYPPGRPAGIFNHLVITLALICLAFTTCGLFFLALGLATSRFIHELIFQITGKNHIHKRFMRWTGF